MDLTKSFGDGQTIKVWHFIIVLEEKKLEFILFISRDNTALFGQLLMWPGQNLGRKGYFYGMIIISQQNLK